MAKMERTWPAYAFDTISIRALECKVTIEGTNGDHVNLEGDHEGNLQLATVDGRLQLHTSGNKSETKFALQLPQRKAWAVDLLSGQTQFKAKNIKARLNLMFGKGELQVENCSGALSVMSGRVNIHLKRFTETEIPELPPPPAEWPLINLGDSESWPDWWTGYWGALGGEFAERILKRIFKKITADEQNSGINLQTGKGDLQLENITVREFIARCGKGDVKLNGGNVADFDLELFRGNFECESCMPAGDWDVNVTRGDIRLSLPDNTRARLDVATRQGDIKSTTPMVHVTRQGPEAWHGGRMVGTMGTNLEGTMPEIHLNTLHGNIKIETQRTEGLHHETPFAGEAPPSVTTTGKTAPYDTPLAVLNALKEGRINIKEADRLLHNLDL